MFFSSLYHFISKNCPIYEHLGPNQRGNLAGNGVKNKNRSQFFGDSAHKRLFPLGPRPAAAFSVQKMEHGEDVFVFFLRSDEWKWNEEGICTRKRKKTENTVQKEGVHKNFRKKINTLKTRKKYLI